MNQKHYFIISKGRTGSTLLCSILNINKEVLLINEEPYGLYLNNHLNSKSDLKLLIKRFYQIIEQDQDLQLHSEEKALEILKHKKNITYSALAQLFNVKNKEYSTIIDKELKYTFHLNKLRKLYPESKFIFLVREPKGNITSCITRNLGRSNNHLYQAVRWNLYYNKIKKFISKSSFPYYEIKYEDLILNTKNEIIKLCNYLEIDFTPDMLDYPSKVEDYIQKSNLSKNKANHLKEFHSGLFKNPDKNEVYRYKKVLSTKEIQEINYVTQKVGVFFNYTQEEGIKKPFALYYYYYKILAYFDLDFKLNVYYYLPLRIKVFLRNRTNKTNGAK